MWQEDGPLFSAQSNVNSSPRSRAPKQLQTSAIKEAAHLGQHRCSSGQGIIEAFFRANSTTTPLADMRANIAKVFALITQ
jgi:hypothetical protein